MSYEPNLEFSLKPPKILRDLGTSIARAVVGGVTVTLPTGQVFRASDLPNVVAGSQVNVAQPQAGPTPSSAASQVNRAVEGIPGGWATVGLGAAALVFFLMQSRKRRAA